MARAGTLWNFDADGKVSSDRAGAGLLGPLDGVLIGYLGKGAAGYDAHTGSRNWQTSGTLAAAYDGVVFVCRGSGADVVAAVDAATGAERWRAGIPCEFVASHHYDGTVVAGDRVVDARNELLLLDPSTGRLVLREARDDAGDAQEASFRDDFVVLGLDGQELLRRANGTGVPIGLAAGLLIVAAPDRAAAVDPATGETIWSSTDHSYSSLTVSGDALWSVDAANGDVSRLDPRTGEPSWTATVRATPGLRCRRQPSDCLCGHQPRRDRSRRGDGRIPVVAAPSI